MTKDILLMRALIVIDVQNDFCPNGIFFSRKIFWIRSIKQLFLFDIIVLSQDWHPTTHKSFASNHKNKKCCPKKSY